MPDKANEIGALWSREARNTGKSYMTGKISVDGRDVDIVVFQNNSENPKAPQWRIYKSVPKEERASDSQW